MVLRTISRAALAAALALSVSGAALAGDGRFTQIGPEGGDVTAIRVDPSAPRIVYAGAGLGGLFKSTDGGGSWARLAGAVPVDDHHPVSDLVLDPAEPSTLYVAFGGTVLKSRNAGATFANAGSGIQGRVDALAIDPTHPATLYAAAYNGEANGFYKTVDGGASWQPASPDLAGLWTTSVAVDPRAPETLFVGVEDFDRGGVWKSTDGGATWARKTAGLPPTSAGAGSDGTVQVVVDPEVAGRVFATYTSLSPHARAPKNFRSTDNGETWAELAGAGDYPLAAGRGGLVFAGNRKSTDGGTTWAAVGIPGTPLSSLALDPAAPGRVYAGSADQGVAKSTDGGTTWQSTNRGLWATWVTGLAVDTRAPGLLFAGVVGERLWARPLANGAFRIQSQAAATPFPTSFYALDPDPRAPRVLYAAFQGSLLKSVDSGKTFDALTLPPGNLSCFQYADLAVDPTDPSTLYAGGYPVADRCDGGCNTFKSTDGGATFSCMRRLDRLSRVYVHPARPSTVYALSEDGVFRSPSEGATWQTLTTTSLLSLAFDPRNPEVLYGGGNGIRQSTDGGTTWKAWSRGFSLPVSELILDPRSPGTMYAGVDRTFAAPQQERAGVYRSRDYGRTWSKVPGLPGALFDGLVSFDPIRRVLYAGTLGQGVYAATMR